MAIPYKKSAKRVLVAFLTAASAVFGACAPDLGNIKDADDYKKKFPAVTFIKSDCSYAETEISDLYNEKAVNDFNKKDFECPTGSDAFKYMAVQAGEDLSVKEFAVYVRSETDATLNIGVYGVEKLPEKDKIATGTDADFEPDTDTGTDTDAGTDADTGTDSGESSSGGETRKLKDFDDPKHEDAVAEITVSLKANEWKSFSVKTWKKGGGTESRIRLEKDSWLLFQFRNNCVVYDDAGKIVGNENPPAKIGFTAMLICVG